VSIGTNASDGDDAGLLIHRAAINPLASGEPSGSHGARDESTYDPVAYGITGCIIGTPTANVAICQGTNGFAAGDTIEIAGMSTCSFLNYTSTSPTTQSYTILSTGLSASQFEFNVTHANISCSSDPGYAQGVGGYAGFDAAATCGSSTDKVPWNHCHGIQSRPTTNSSQRIPDLQGYTSQLSNNGGVVATAYDFHAEDVGGSNAAGIAQHIAFGCDPFASATSSCLFDLSGQGDYISGSLYLGAPVSVWFNYPSNGAGSVFSTGQHQGTAFVAVGVPGILPNGPTVDVFESGIEAQTGTGGVTPAALNLQANGGPTVFGGFVSLLPTATVSGTPSPSNTFYLNYWNGTTSLSPSFYAGSLGDIYLTPTTTRSLILTGNYANANGTLLPSTLNGYNGNASGVKVPLAVAFAGVAGVPVCDDGSHNLTETGCTVVVTGTVTSSSGTATTAHSFSTSFGATPVCTASPYSNSGSWYFSTLPSVSSSGVITYMSSGAQTFSIQCVGTGGVW
jgi:hypothetical protein